MKLEPIDKGGVPACGVLKSEDQQAIGSECSRRGLYDVLQAAEIDQRVCGDNQVERVPAVAKVLGQLALHEFVVDFLFLCPIQHSGRKVDT